MDLKEEYKKLEEDYRKLNALLTSTQTAIKDLEKNNSMLKDKVIYLTELNMNAEKALNINKDIMRNTIVQDNAMKNQYVEEIGKLKKEIKNLKGA